MLYFIALNFYGQTMDLRKLKTLLELFENSGLTEMEFSEGEERVRLSKAAGVAPPAAAPSVAPAVAAASAAETPAAAAAENGAEEKAAGDGTPVTSPMVGTFYRSASPEKPPFVRIGQRVAAGDTLCIIEAMKLMNEIPAPKDGVVREILAENGAPVSYGEALFVIG